MADVGEVKAKVIIEYDGSGLEQAKKDLASLAESAGSAGESAQGASDGLANLDQQMGKNAESAKSFGAAIDELPKMVESGGTAVSEMTSALDEHQAAIEETGSAYEDLQKSVGETTENFQKAAPSMQMVNEHAQSMTESLSQAQQSFSDMNATIAEPGATEAYSRLFQSVAGESFAASPLGNLQAFQAALASPDSFQMIDAHLDKTGQSYGQFANSLSEGNQQILHEMSTDWAQTNSLIDESGKSFVNAGRNAREGFSAISSGAGEADQAVSEFLGKSSKGATFEGATFGGAFGETFSAITGALNEIAMPLMAVQMIGMAVGQVGQAIYDSAVIAEGAGAHSFGTFTGTVDALGQSAQKAGASFSEGFGQGLLPTLNALNEQAAQAQDSGGFGGFVGGVASIIANATMITTGINPQGGWEGLINDGAALLGMSQPYQGPPPVSQYQQQMSQLPQTVRASADQLRYQSNLTLADAVDPNWLAANDQATASQGAAQYLIGSYNRSHPISQYQAIQQAREQYYDVQQAQNYQQQMNNPTYGPLDIGGYWGGVFGGLGDAITHIGAPGSISALSGLFGGGGGPQSSSFDGLFGGNGKGAGGFGNFIGPGAGGAIGGLFGGIGDVLSHLFGGGGGVEVPASTFGGCFIAGTHVLMADGSSKTIETLQIGERVLAHNGKKQVHATITDYITFPAKQTYKLVFSDGPILFTTDSHPIATTRGWKSISPASTAQENPGLPVTTLAVGDNIYTADGTICRLVSLQKHDIVQVFNITVNASHTYYANNILVHNAKLGSSGGMTNGGVGSEVVSLSHTFTANVTWEANNLAKQFTGVASWAAQGLSNTFQGIANWVGQGLSNTFQGIANWVGQGLANTFQGIANWVGQGLQNTFQGIANWVGQGLQNTFQGVANWVGQGLNNTFKGIASWLGSGLEHTFNAVANWTAQNLTPNFTVNPSFTMLAEGTSNWGGGPAIVGEAGPEVVESNGQYSMFNQGASLVDLPSGSNVYPMKNLQSSSVTQFADGIGGGAISSGGSSSGNIPQSINLHLQIGDAVFSQMGISLAQNMRLTAGLRGY